MAYISKEDNDIEQNFDILDLNTKLSKKSTPWIKNTPSYMAEPFKCHEIDIINSYSLREDFKSITMSITFHDRVGLQDLLLYPGMLSGHGCQEL